MDPEDSFASIAPENQMICRYKTRYLQNYKKKQAKIFQKMDKLDMPVKIKSNYGNQSWDMKKMGRRFVWKELQRYSNNGVFLNQKRSRCNYWKKQRS